MSHYLGPVGILSGFDPQSQYVTLSYLLRTAMATYARVNNRVAQESIHMFGTLQANIEGTIECRFLLPKNASDVVLWSPGYKFSARALIG